MNLFSGIGFSLLIFLCSCSSENNSKSDDSKGAGEVQKNISFEYYYKHLSQDETPLKVIEIPALSDVEITIPSYRDEIGAIVKDGYNMIKRYPKCALTVINVDNTKENFSTSYSSFYRFSSNEKNELRLILKNEVDEKIEVLLYKK